MFERLEIKVPYLVRPDLRLLEPGVPILHWTGDSAQAVTEKLQHYLRQTQVVGNTQAAAVLYSQHADAVPALEAAIAILAQSDPTVSIARSPAGGLTGLQVSRPESVGVQLQKAATGDWEALGSGALPELINQAEPGQRLWLALGLVLHEDLVLMHWDDSQQALLAEQMHVSFPSGWIPSHKHGQSFAQIHQPVADSALLRTAAKALGRNMVERGPFERFVWTLTDSASRARFPVPDRATTTSGAPLWLRWERQITVPLPHFSRCLFLIRVYLTPLEQVFQDPLRKRAILASLASMSEAVIDYKGLSAIRQRLLG